MIRFGLNIGQQQCRIGELVACWKRAEELGYDWLSLWDHFYPDTLPLSEPIFEGGALHAAMACLTTRPRLGSTVYCASFRHPGVLAKAAVTIDHLSGGRLELGLGAGWYEEEFNAYGIPFEAPATRLRRLREYAEIVRALWTQESVDYQGEFYVLRNAFCSPKPLQSPPRIWLGTLGEKIGLPLAGEVGDAWNCSLQSPESFKRKRDLVLTNARDASTFLTSINIPFVPAPSETFEKELRERFALRWEGIKDLTLTGSSQRMIDMLVPYVEAGADYIILSIRAPFDHEGLAQFAEEVIPALTRRTQIAM